VCGLGGEKLFCLKHEGTLPSIRRYGRYHRPIAQPPLFWLNERCYMSLVGLRRPNDDLAVKLEVQEIVAKATREFASCGATEVALFQNEF
jgi:hypothetical protein